jgi:hypothetical protein
MSPSPTPPDAETAAPAEQAEIRLARRTRARLRDLVADLRSRDEELLALRDKARSGDRALGHELSAGEVRRIADAHDTILRETAR